jgi:hypothetical protein
MKANSTHISLETAKLLKDCGIDSRYFYVTNDGILDTNNFVNIADSFDSDFKRTILNNYYPAYTWQEILWEYHDKFFGEDDWIATPQILEYLQKKQYKQADGWFRIHCILLPDYK